MSECKWKKKRKKKSFSIFCFILCRCSLTQLINFTAALPMYIYRICVPTSRCRIERHTFNTLNASEPRSRYCGHCRNGKMRARTSERDGTRGNRKRSICMRECVFYLCLHLFSLILLSSALHLSPSLFSSLVFGLHVRPLPLYNARQISLLNLKVNIFRSLRHTHSVPETQRNASLSCYPLFYFFSNMLPAFH